MFLFVPIADYDACASSPCLNGGTCQTTNANRTHYSCICLESVEGDNCQSEGSSTRYTYLAPCALYVLTINDSSAARVKSLST